MNNLQNFQGELLLIDTPDGGDIQLADDLFINDLTFNTAVYISLFGGNKEDNGRVKNKYTWWGNTLDGVMENEKIVSRFQAIIFSLPMTSKNIQEAETAAELDLQWLIDEGIADIISVTGNATGHNTFNLLVEIKSGETTIFNNTYSLFWRAGIYGENL